MISVEIEAYLDTIAEPHNGILRHLHAVIRAAAPEAAEAIAYGIPTFRLDGNLVHYAGFKRHMSFFPGSTAHNEALKKSLAGYKLAKGTIQFTSDNVLPDDLVTRIVKLRVEENHQIAIARKAAKG